MTTKVKEEKHVAEDKKEEEKFKPADYSCEILLEKTTLEKSNDRSFPTDAFNITYEIDGEEYLDVARSSKRVNIFDLYEGEGIPEGKKSIAISIVLQPQNKTLKDSEIDLICKKIISNVVDSTGAVLREK